MRQVFYVSVSTAEDGRADLESILEQSRHNNALDGVTGLLWSDGRRFMQVLEGPEHSVGPTFARIRADPRHKQIETLIDRHVEEREFGYWSMNYRNRREPADEFDARMRRLFERLSPAVRDAFHGLLSPAS